jgi:hypothetical protein
LWCSPALSDRLWQVSSVLVVFNDVFELSVDVCGVSVNFGGLWRFSGDTPTSLWRMFLFGFASVFGISSVV